MYTSNIGQENTALLQEVPDLTVRATMLSTEENDTVIKQFANFFVNKIDAIAGVFSKNKTRVPGVLDKEYNQFVKDLVAVKKDIEPIISTVKFSHVETMAIPVMLGLRGDLIHTVEQLKTGMDIVNKSLLTSLSETDKVVAKVLSDNNYRTATRPTNNDNHADYESYSKLSDILTELIDSNGVKDTKKLKELLPNVSSIETLYNTLLDIANTNTLKNMKEIESAIKIISERTNVLFEDMGSDMSTVEMSKPIAYHLANRLEVTAKLVTTSISIMHVYNQTVLTLIYIINRLNK